MHSRIYFVIMLLVLLTIAIIYFINDDRTAHNNESDDSKGLGHNHDITDEAIINQMSLDEKIGQMIFAGISGTSANQKTKELIHKYKIGGIILYAENIETSKQTLQLLNQLKMENEDNPQPLLLGIDQEGGDVSRLPKEIIHIPTNQEIGARNNSQFSYEIGTLLGKELNAFGFNLNFAPVLDVNSNPNNPVIGDRSFSNDTDVVSKLGIKTMKGIQSQNVISVIKHFPGHGDTSVDSHLNLPVVDKSLEQLDELELLPFKEAIDNGADAVMIAHLLLPKIDGKFPSSMSKKVITDILREQLAFDGVVISDDMTMNAITNNYDMKEAAVESVLAGSDIILVAHDYNKIIATVDTLKQAVIKGEISEDRINESVRRIIGLKNKYTIRDKKVKSIDIETLNQFIRNILNQYFE
ncbi:beta-N-acetylhexosaminidase [Gracilibacillus dipsosauri]|uniref:beta-N-acetylhexosaminidase n=1 Tax=Gracilibacillus dipsosauri TaxID=178340 RepID=UPI0032422346